MIAARARAIGLAAVLAVAAAGAQEAPAAPPESPEPAPPPAEVSAEEAPEASTETPAEAPPEAVDLDRIAFEFRVPETRGGGVVTGTAGAVETIGESTAELTGGVEIRYRNQRFRADHVVLHRDAMTLEAEGDVVFDQGSRRLAAARADFDLVTETGSFWHASAYAEPDQYLRGELLVKTGENTFEIRDGVVTSCTGDPTPDWSLRVSSAEVELGGYAHLKNARMRMKKLPLFYWPYLIWPAKTERSSGFLIPNVGYSPSRGGQLGIAYYQVMGPSADLTLMLDGWETTWAGAGAELRYQPTEGTSGRILGYLLSNRDLEQDEWRAIWKHTTTDLPLGLRGVINVNHYSDFEFYREFQRSEGENTRSNIYSNAFLSGNRGAQSFSMIVDQRESFLSGGRTSTQRQLPEVTYGVRKLRLGRSQLYFSLDTTASYLSTQTDDSFDVSYGRFDVAPQLTLPLRVAPWISVALSGGGRTTWWGESLPGTVVDEETGTAVRVCDDGPIAEGQVFCGDSLSRTFTTAQADIVGPSFSKIFDSPGGAFEKFKHVIEPRFKYRYVGEFDEQRRVYRFDEIDSFSTSRTGSVELVNRVLAKPSDPTRGGAFEILSFSLAQNFSFVDEQPLQRSSDGSRTSRESPIVASLRVSPSRTFDLQARAVWSTLFAELASTSLSVRAKGERAGLDVTWYTNYNPELGRETSDQTRFGFNLDVIKDRLRLSGQVNYDLLTSEVQQQRYFLRYTSQCWDVLLEGREQTTSRFVTRDYRFLLNLKNVGSFLDVNGGTRERF
jgi:LPS-assembly protein